MVLIRDGLRYHIRGFMQETRSKSQDNAQREFSPLGEVCLGLYTFIGPVEPLAMAGDRIEYQQRVFEVRRAEAVMMGNKTMYCWGLCVERGAVS